MAPISEAVGWVNIAYISGAASLGWFVDYRLFVAATSWVHYLKYIHQYYFRAAKGDLARYKAWQRDVLLYKTIALLNLAYIYFGPHYDPATGAFDWSALDAVSLAVVIAGYFISISATQALGIDGTYFGIELGFVEADYQFVKGFPYNCLPHPMILGQVLALLGLFKPRHVHSFSLAAGGGVAGFRQGNNGGAGSAGSSGASLVAELLAPLLPGPESGLDGWWWLVPVHVALYLVHMTQEILDIWKGVPWYKAQKKS